MEISKTYCCCCFSAGSVETVVKAPVSGYCPGQKIPVEITCTNNSYLDIHNIKLRLVKEIEYVAIRLPGRRIDKDVVKEITKGGVFANTRRILTIDMDVPTVDVYNLSGCSYIYVEYKLEVVVVSNECHSDTETSYKIIIGTTPLVGFQDNVVMSLQNQVPPQIPAITEQPTSSLPDTSPIYPGDISKNTPYPNSPNHNPHYPATFASPSNPNAPYLTNYTFNSPHLPNNQPYSPTNRPYPANNSSISPYPNQNPSYPDDPPPYPGNPPYLAGQQNPPTIGFIVPPAGHFAVVPTSPVPVPYTTASAPTLD